jgi:hypothetical protein
MEFAGVWRLALPQLRLSSSSAKLRGALVVSSW